MKNWKTLLGLGLTALALSGPAAAADTNLRIQVIFGADTDTGKLIASFVGRCGNNVRRRHQH